jgi:uncharacterized membrane protein
MSASHRRSLVKTATFRIAATIATVLIVFVFTGKIVLSLGIGLIEAVVKTLMYYLHERIWAKIKWQ